MMFETELSDNKQSPRSRLTTLGCMAKPRHKIAAPLSRSGDPCRLELIMSFFRKKTKASCTLLMWIIHLKFKCL